MLTRRAALAAPLALVPVPAGAVMTARGALNRAMARAGGRDRLEAGRVLRWTARAGLSGFSEPLVSETTLTPGFARTAVWPADEGPAAAQIQVVSAREAYGEREGARTSMTPALAAYSRAHYALLALARLTPLLEVPVAFTGRPDHAVPGARNFLDFAHASAPPALLQFDDEARLLAIDALVPDPNTGAPVPERLTFSGTIADAGYLWFRRIAVQRAGRTVLDLELTRFSARGA